MRSDKRKSGISQIGELPWGSHICQFYQTKEDLLEIFLPYFEVGLKNNEFCLWVTSEMSANEDGKSVLKKSVPHFAEYADRGQMEIVSYSQWHHMVEKSGDALGLILDRAVSGGFDGVRIACDAISDKERDKAFTCFDVDAMVRFNLLALFAYRRDQFDALGLMETIRNHRFALVRNGGQWDLVESSEARIVKEELKRNEEKLNFLFSNMSEGFAYHRIVLDAGGKPCDYVFLEVNDAFGSLTGLAPKEIVGKRASVVLPGIENDPADWIGKYGRVALTGKPVQFESYAVPLNRWFSVSAFSSNKGFFAVTFCDITERKQAEEDNARLNEELKGKIAELSAANDLLRESRLAALNMMEDAIAARRQAEEASAELRATNEELERFNSASVGRELRMIELKKEVNGLCGQLARPPRYPLDFEEER